MIFLKNIFNWLGSGFFRKLGSILCYLIIGTLFIAFLSSKDIKLPKLFNHMYVHAWGNLNDYREARAGINQRVCNSSHTNCTVSSNVTLQNLNTYLSYLPCTDFQCPNNERNSDYVGVFRVSLSFNDNHSFDNDCYYRLWYTFQLQGLNTNQVVLNNLEEINSSIYLINHSYNTTNNANGMFGDGSIPQIYFERISASGFVRLAVIFHPNDSGYHYVDTTFGLKNPNMTLSWNNMPPFKGFNSIRVSTASAQYTRNTTEQEQVITQMDKQNWIDVNNHIGQVENAVNDLNDNLNDTDISDSEQDFDDFFNEEFSSSSDSFITELIQLPFTFLQSLVLGSEEDLCFTLKNVTSCFPNGQKTLWNKDFTGHSSLFSGVVNNTSRNAFKSFFNLAVGGILSYKMILMLIRKVHDWLMPDKSVVEVMDL